MLGETTRKLHWVHRWLGVLLSANLLILSVTGLVLVFRREIDAVMHVAPVATDRSPSSLPTNDASLQTIVANATRHDPTRVPRYLSWAEDDYPGVVFVSLARVVEGKDAEATTLAFDKKSADILPMPDSTQTFSGWVERLHVNLFLGTAGQIYIGIVGLAFMAMIVTGFLLYSPFTKGQPFAAIRTSTWSFRWADLHKVLGAATAMWNLVVAGTGALLALGGFLFQLYQATELGGLKASTNPSPPAIVTVDMAVAQAQQGMKHPSLVALPGGELSGDNHFIVLLQGESAIEKRLLSLAVIDARSGDTQQRELPWYLRAMLLSEPLHFGNYGGLALKIIWSLFSAVTIALTTSGFALWVTRRRRAYRPRQMPGATEGRAAMTSP